MTLISVIICTYNRAEMLRAALSDLAAQATDGRFYYEIVVVDDASSDHTPQVVEGLTQSSTTRVKYVRGAGRGYTEALNTGVAAARGDWLAFFDDDQRTGSTWLKELLAAADAGTTDLVGGPIVLRFDEYHLERLGPHCRALCGEYPHFKQARHPNRIPPPAGGNRLVHRRVFDVIGQFDPTFETGGCDRDFLFRAAASGFHFGWAPNAVVWHRVTVERGTPERVRRYSLQTGVASAYIDWKHRGAVAAASLCVARICRVFLVTMPLLIVAYIHSRDRFTILDLNIAAWIAHGYTRRTLFLIAPRWFPQNRFFADSRFRNLRIPQTALSSQEPALMTQAKASD